MNNFKINKIFPLKAIVLLLLCTSFVLAQAFSFKHITSRNGLTQSEVYSFLQDSKGFMWIGTLAGLNRFDGYSIKQFSIDKYNPNGLSNNTIRALAEDKNGNIWIGTDIGIDIFVPRLDRFFKLNLPNAEEGKLNNVYNILLFNNLMFVVSHNGLLLFDTNRLEFDESDFSKNAIVDISDLTTSDSFLTHSLHYIHPVSSNKIIVGNYETFKCYELSNGKLKQSSDYKVLTQYLKSIRFLGIKTIIKDKDKNLWVLSNSNGVVRYRINQNKIDIFSINNTTFNTLSSNIAQCATIDNDGNLWIGTLDNGVNFIPVKSLSEDSVQVQVIKNNALNRTSPGGNLIYSLYTSRDNNVWVGTIGNGVSYYNPIKKNFTVYRIPPKSNGEQGSNFIRAIFQDKYGIVWLGIHNNGLYVFNKQNGTFKKVGLGNYSVMNIKGDLYNRDEILVSSVNGFHIFNTRTYNQIKIDGIDIDKNYFNIIQTAKNIYWLAGIDGISQYKRMSNKLIRTVYITDNSEKFKIPNSNTRILTYDEKRNQLWAGSEGGGLYKLSLTENQDIKSITVFNSTSNGNKSISNNYIRSLCIKNNELWIGTFDGLNMLNPDKEGNGFRSFSTTDGLPNNMIQSIESHNDDLWIGTNGGLSCFNPTTKKIINYNFSDGLQSNEFSEHTSFTTADGTMLFGGIDGFNIFHPDKILIYEKTPNVIITNISINNQDIVPHKKVNKRVITNHQIYGNDTLELKHTENNIRIEFASPFFASPDKVKYRFRLNGHEKDWQEIPSNMRFINYTNLSHGTYELFLSASNGEGGWNNPTKLLINIQTPFYFTWWAILIYILVFIIVFYYLTNFSVIEITEKNKLLFEHEHNEKLKELNEQRTKFFINVSHELRTPITLIINPLVKIISEMSRVNQLDKELNIVLRNAQRLKVLTDQLLDFRKLELGVSQLNKSSVNIFKLIDRTVDNFLSAFLQKHVQFVVEKPQNELFMMLDEDKFEKAICNILSNALKYTPVNGNAGVRMSFSDTVDARKELILEFYDSGTGIPESDREKVFERFYSANNDNSGYGIGLHFTREIIIAHEGSIKAETSSYGGASFVISLPISEVLNANEIPSDSKEKSFSNLIARTFEFEEFKPNAYSSDKPTLFVVEDNADMRFYLGSLLQNEYNVILSEDGRMAIEKLKEMSPDLILSDIMMPFMDGLELCEYLKSNIDTSHIPLILLTARDDMETKFSGYDKGADAYIMKPFDDNFLQLRIRKLIEARSQMRSEYKASGNVNHIKTEINFYDQNFIDKVIQYVDENLNNEDFSIDSLESLVGVSHSSMFRKMKALFGMTGIEFLQDRRLTKAAELLRTINSVSVAEVAYKVGYSNPKYFSKCFKEKFGKTPTEYIKGA